jgi:hypothetical protein
MELKTKYPIGATITVKLDGVMYKGKVTEVRVLMRAPDCEQINTYAARVRYAFTNDKGKEITYDRDWIGSEDEVVA